MLRQGTIVDATIINAPSSTKNKEKQRDPEMSSTKKGNTWYFGMKAHVGTDSCTGLVHSVVCTTAKVHDSEEFDELLHGDECELYGDKAYANESKKQHYEAKGKIWNVARKGTRSRPLSERDKAWNTKRNRVRAKGEHSFGVVKHLWGYAKTRFRGIEKNASQIFILFSLANLYMVRHQIIGMHEGKT